jgi:riboflavin biosynthesis pyrimidine reductase
MRRRIVPWAGGDAWIVGRTTMAEFAEGEPRPAKASETYPRATWRAAAAGKGPFALALDRSGRLHLNRDRVNGDPLIAILTTAVSDDHLAELRRDGISHVFAGDDDIDLGKVLEIIGAEFGVKHLLLEGGGGINGGFLEQGLIDEISLMVLPLADGKPDAPTTFDGNTGGARSLELVSVDKLYGGILHLKYRVVS